MRVVLISRYPKTIGKPKGGVEAVTVILAHALSDLEDIEVHVLAVEKGRSAESNGRDDQVHVHRLPGSSWPQMADIFRGPGRKRLLQKIAAIDPAIIHSHETYGLNLGTLRRPNVFTVHGFDHANIPAEGRRQALMRSILWRRVEAYGLRRQRHIISISPYVRQMIEPLTKARIHEIDNPIDLRFFKIDREEQPGRVLCVGWINERKNTATSIAAFGEALASGASGTLVIAGEAANPAYLDKVKRTIARYRIEKKVEFLGHIDHARLKVELSRASVLLLPSLQENAPMAISEAMAARLPVIASDRCGMPYMIADGKSGYLVEPMDVSGISQRLKNLLDAPDLRRQMGQVGRCIAEDRFHPAKVAQKTFAVYRAVLEDYHSAI